MVKVPEMLFNPGAVNMTPGVMGLIEGEKLEFADVISFLARHLSGDWGEICAEDAEANEGAVADGGQLMSVYTSASGTTYWVITESDRTITTFLLPDDY